MELLEGEKKEDFYEVRENKVIIVIFDLWSLLSSLNMVIIVFFEHGRYCHL